MFGSFMEPFNYMSDMSVKTHAIYTAAKQTPPVEYRLLCNSGCLLDGWCQTMPSPQLQFSSRVTI